MYQRTDAGLECAKFLWCCHLWVHASVFEQCMTCCGWLASKGLLIRPVWNLLIRSQCGATGIIGVLADSVTFSRSNGNHFLKTFQFNCSAAQRHQGPESLHTVCHMP
jgi:hypothetical protein